MEDQGPLLVKAGLELRKPHKVIVRGTRSLANNKDVQSALVSKRSILSSIHLQAGCMSA